MIASLARQGGRRYTQMRGVAGPAETWSLISLGSGGATPTPTPTPATARAGGTSRRTTLPQYYSRRIYGDLIQLPQDEQALEVAQEVLSQVESVVEDLQDGAEYDVLLKTVDQLSRIVAAQIESRQIYNVIEETRARVQAKKDAEIRAYIQAAIDEEDEVKELMEFL